MKTILVLVVSAVLLGGLTGCKLKVEPPDFYPERHYGL